MKLILFLIIILVIYFLATQIKVVHIDTLPDTQKNELETRNKIRSMLLWNHIKCPTDSSSKQNKINVPQTNNTVEKFTNIREMDYPSANDLISMVRSEYLDEKYHFNIANQPSTSRYPSSNTLPNDKSIMKHIKNSINEWNELVTDRKNPIKIIDIKPIFIMETSREFVVKSNIKLFYQDKTMHLEVVYYGQIDKTDDFINGGINRYIMQLVSLKPIHKNHYEPKIKTFGENSGAPFMTMDEQMKYVEKINKMHMEDDGN